MKTIISIILAMLIAVSGTTVIDEEALLKDLTPDKESVATFIEDNFSLFVQKCNEEAEDGEIFNATGIESKQNITVYSVDDADDVLVDAIFLDFSGDDGYAVLADDYILYDFQIEGASPYINIDYDEMIYSVIYGYYYTKDGEIYSVIPDTNENLEEDGEDDNLCSPTTTTDYTRTRIQNSIAYYYDLLGKKTINECKPTGMYAYGKLNNKLIIYPSNYVHYTYDKNKEWAYTLFDANSLNFKSSYDMMQLSVYRQFKNNVVSNDYREVFSSEGNCFSVAIYNCLQYYADNFYFGTMPKSTVTTNYYPAESEPKIYSSIFNKKGKNKTKTVTFKGESYYTYMLNTSDFNESKIIHSLYDDNTNSFKFPALWAYIRETMDNDYGNNKYIINGVGSSTSKKVVKKVIDKVCSHYGAHVELSIEDPIMTSYIKKQINNGNPVIINTLDDPIYGTHAMACCGYATYKKTVNSYILKKVSYVYLLEVKSGWEIREDDLMEIGSSFIDISKTKINYLTFLEV